MFKMMSHRARQRVGNGPYSSHTAQIGMNQDPKIDSQLVDGLAELNQIVAIVCRPWGQYAHAGAEAFYSSFFEQVYSFISGAEISRIDFLGNCI